MKKYTYKFGRAVMHAVLSVIPLRLKAIILVYLCHTYNIRVIAPYWNGKLKVLAPSDGVLLSLLRFGNYNEYNDMKFVCRLLSSSSLIVDIGANVGFWSLVLANIVRSGTGRVYAFEPTPSTFFDLQVNMLLNGFDQKLVVAISLAVGDKDGDSILNCYEDIGSSCGWNTLDVPWMTDRGGIDP